MPGARRAETRLSWLTLEIERILVFGIDQRIHPELERSAGKKVDAFFAELTG
jgi:hypothetical protein